MSGRFFLDTNIFVYASDGTNPPKAKRAQALMREAVATQKGVVSYQVVQEFFNLALRRFPKPMATADAEGIPGYSVLSTSGDPLFGPAVFRGFAHSGAASACPGTTSLIVGAGDPCRLRHPL